MTFRLPSNEDILNCPEEKRTRQYRDILVKDNETIDYLSNWPGLLRDERMRAEALPIYYGENIFHLELPTVEEGWMPFTYDMFSRLQKGGLEHIQQLHARAHGKWGNEYNPRVQCDVGFMLLGTVKNQFYKQFKDQCRIGNDGLDWNDHQAVADAYEAAIRKDVPEDDYEIMRQLVSIPVIAKSLYFLAKDMPQARALVVLSWGYPAWAKAGRAGR